MENIDIENIDNESLTELLELSNGLEDALNEKEEELNGDDSNE